MPSKPRGYNQSMWKRSCHHIQMKPQINHCTDSNITGKQYWQRERDESLKRRRGNHSLSLSQNKSWELHVPELQLSSYSSTRRCEKWVNQNVSTHLLQVNGRGSVTVGAGSTKWPDRHRISPSGAGVGSCCDSGWQRPGSLRRDRDEEWGRSRRRSEICSSFLARCANGVRQHWGRQSGASSCAAQAGSLQSSIGRETTHTLNSSCLHTWVHPRWGFKPFW